MRVREGRPGDLPRLREIQRTELSEPWPDLLETAVHGPPPLYVLEDGVALGYALVVGDSEDVAHVPEFAVHPEVQGQGYGSELMSSLQDRLADEGYGTLRLAVRTDDERARRFYAAHGFERSDHLPDYFEDGDGLLLSCALAGDDS